MTAGASAAASRPVVLSTSDLHPATVNRLEAAAQVRIASDASAETLLREARDVDVIIVRDPIPEELFTAAPRLRAAVRHGAGLDMIPVDAATRAGVLVANVPGANAQSVAEHAILMMLALSRKLRAVDIDLRASGWAAGRAHASTTRQLAGLTLGLIGTGNVGRAIVQIASGGFGMRVLGHGSRPDRVPEGIESRPLADLLLDSDVVVVACPLTPATRGLLDAASLGQMRPDAVLVNVARGPIIDDEALITALQERRIGGAALDVFTEQPLPPDHPYLALDNAVITPHVAGITRDSLEVMGLGAAQAALAVLAGDVPDTTVNPEVLPRYRARDGDPA